MKYLFVAMAIGAAALSASAANAAGGGKARPNAQVSQSTDVSAQHRHHGRRHHNWHPQRHGYHRPPYRSYGYYPRHHGYYGGRGPGVRFGYGGSRW